MENTRENDREDQPLPEVSTVLETPSELTEPALTPVTSPPRRWIPLGYLAFALAVILAVTEGVAISLAYSNQQALATAVGQVLVVLTALPLALGLFVAWRGPKREWGVAAMIVAVVANPLILVNVLSFFGTF